MEINQLKAGAILSYISLFISNMVMLFYTPFMLRQLGPSEYGVYALMGSLIGYLGLLELGFGNAIVRYIAKYRVENDKEKESNLAAICLIIYGGIGAVALILGSILYSYIGDIFSNSLTVSEIAKAKIIFVIMMVNLALSFPFSVFRSIMSGYERFVWLRTVTIIISILMPCMMIPLLLLGYKSIAIVVVQTILNLMAGAINIWYVLFVLRVRVKLFYFDLKFFKEFSRYTVFIFLIAIVNQIYWNTDQIILGMVANSATVAVYAIATQMSGFFMALSSSISTVFLPKATQMVVKEADNTQLTDILIRIGRLQLVVLGLFLLGFSIFGKEFISLWAGQEYIDAWLIAVILMTPNTIPLIQQFAVSILQAKNLHGFRSVLYLIIAIVNVLVSIPLAVNYGGIGSAIGTAMALIVGNIIIINLYYYYKVGLEIPRFFKELSKGMFLSMTLSALFGGLLLLIPIGSWAGLFVKCMIFCLIYTLIMWGYGFNAQEKNLVLGPLSNAGKKIKNLNHMRGVKSGAK